MKISLVNQTKKYRGWEVVFSTQKKTDPDFARPVYNKRIKYNANLYILESMVETLLEKLLGEVVDVGAQEENEKGRVIFSHHYDQPTNDPLSHPESCWTPWPKLITFNIDGKNKPFDLISLSIAISKRFFHYHVGNKKSTIEVIFQERGVVPEEATTFEIKIHLKFFYIDDNRCCVSVENLLNRNGAKYCKNLEDIEGEFEFISQQYFESAQVQNKPNQANLATTLYNLNLNEGDSNYFKRTGFLVKKEVYEERITEHHNFLKEQPKNNYKVIIPSSSKVQANFSTLFSQVKTPQQKVCDKLEEITNTPWQLRPLGASFFFSTHDKTMTAGKVLAALDVKQGVIICDIHHGEEGLKIGCQQLETVLSNLNLRRPVFR